MNKIISIILIFILSFTTLFSFSVSNATSSVLIEGINVSEEEIELRLKQLKTESPFELMVSDFAVDIFDSIEDYIVFLLKDEITVDRLIFNKVLALNPNFFEANKTLFVPKTTKIICDLVNNWYSLFKGLAIISYLIVLIFIGIKILLRNSYFKS